MLRCIFERHEVNQTHDLGSGEVITQFVKVPWTVTNWFELTKSTMPQVLILFMATAYLAYLDARIGMLSCALVASAFVAFYHSLETCRAVSDARDRAHNAVQERIDDLLRNMQAVYTADQKQAEQVALRPYEDASDRLYVRTMMCTSKVKVWLVPVTLIVMAMIAWRCIHLLSVGRLSVGAFVSVLAIALYMLTAISRIVQYGRLVVYYLGILRSLADTWCGSDSTAAAAAVPAAAAAAAAAPAAAAADKTDYPVLSLRSVSYVYNTATEAAVRDASLDVRDGDRVAIVGGIGSGKTTLVKLIMRLIEPTSGQLYVRGVPYPALGASHVRRTFGYVPQSAPLFDRTVLENIGYGTPGLTEADAWRAARSVGLDGVIARFAEGMSTRCGKGGTRLSGGQRQAVWLVRMRVRDAQVLVLDEPTSAMDAPTRREVSAALATGFATSIFITHDDALVRELATRVVRMHEGRLVELA
jgi:ABC-type multidrug transport system fused ATPase/permease subunit